MTPASFTGSERFRFIEQIEGLRPGCLDPKRITMPGCWGNPDTSSGVCNPLLPLRPNEPCECALARSCLVARLLRDDPNVDPAELAGKPYEFVLTFADQVWAALEVTKQEESDRQRLRAQVVAAKLTPPRNPYRPGSLRHFVLEALAKAWLSLPDLNAKIVVSMPQARNVQLVLDFVTSLTSQESGSYRIVEAGGQYRAYER